LIGCLSKKPALIGGLFFARVSWQHSDSRLRGSFALVG